MFANRRTIGARSVDGCLAAFMLATPTTRRQPSICAEALGRIASRELKGFRPMAWISTARETSTSPGATATIAVGVDEFSPDLKHRKDLGISLYQPQGLLATRSGAILVVETGSNSAIEEFAPREKTPKVVLGPPGVLTEIAIDHSRYALWPELRRRRL
jgi:hypothetical protein